MGDIEGSFLRKILSTVQKAEQEELAQQLCGTTWRVYEYFFGSIHQFH